MTAVRLQPPEPGGAGQNWMGQPDTPPPPVPVTFYHPDMGNAGGAGPGQVGVGGPGPDGLQS
jgi:hypothetical protein